MTCILDTGVYVLLLSWVNREDMQCKVQMERWNGLGFDINATYPDFGQKCLQLPGMLTLSHSNTNSYPFVKGNITAMNIK